MRDEIFSVRETLCYCPFPAGLYSFSLSLSIWLSLFIFYCLSDGPDAYCLDLHLCHYLHLIVFSLFLQLFGSQYLILFVPQCRPFVDWWYLHKSTLLDSSVLPLVCYTPDCCPRVFSTIWMNFSLKVFGFQVYD